MQDEIKIIYKPVSELLPSARNSRVHSDDQVQQIAASIRAFGFVKPVLIDEQNEIIAGHGSVKAAKLLKLKKVPCVVLSHLDDTKRRALLIADNKIPMNAAWDMHILQMELKNLEESGFDMKLLAFSETELGEIFGEETGEGKTEDDAAPAVVKGPPTSKLGDLWILGDHRLLCGSATNPADVKRLMKGELASLIFTDPPYGVSYKADGHKDIENDELRGDELCKSLLVPAFKNMAHYSQDDAAFYIWHASSTRDDFTFAMKVASIEEKQYLMWVKPSFVFGRSDYHQAFEPCFYAAKSGQTPKFHGNRKQDTTWRVTHSGDKDTATTIGRGLLLIDGDGGRMFVKGSAPKAGGKIRNVRVEPGKSVTIFSDSSDSTVWEVARESGEYVHPTQKPVELASRAIENSSAPFEIVLDLFSGSGSTLIAAEKAKRKCYGTDLEPHYIDVIVRRWQEYTGKKAILEGTKKTFEEVKLERGDERETTEA